MDTNYIYLIISLIIFIYVYYFIDNTGSRDTADINSSVLIEINDNIIRINAKNIYNHLALIKDNLFNINKMNFTYDQDIANQIAYLIKVSRTDLTKFKNINNYTDLETQNVDVYASNFDKLLLDVNVTLLLLKQNSVGHIKLTNLHSLVKLLGVTVHGENYENYNELFNFENYYMPTDTRANNSRVTSNKVQLSQNNIGGYGTEDYDGEEFANEQANIIFSANTKPIKKNKNIIYNNYNTQMFGHSDKMDISIRNTIKHYVPFCNINKLKKEYTDRNVFVDKESRRGLRNDYNL